MTTQEKLEKLLTPVRARCGWDHPLAAQYYMWGIPSEILVSTFGTDEEKEAFRPLWAALTLVEQCDFDRPWAAED